MQAESRSEDEEAAQGRRSGTTEDSILPSSTTVGEAVVPVATFLDTPGQEIFYRMRTNGAKVADAVLLVISGGSYF